ncbi:MAG: DUF2807 domain-containing protein [Bacteroidales bacterium]|nr:DUF2807 domain-containing protein [Bacteroidales bacterium]
MKNRLNLILSGILLLGFTSCIDSFLCIDGDGFVASEIRSAKGFHIIENTTEYDIIYRKSDTTGILITTDLNLMDHIVTEIVNNTLEIKTRPRTACLNFSNRSVITVAGPHLDRVLLSGSGSLAADEMSGDRVSIKISGSGDISVDRISCHDFSAAISGSGDIFVGNADCTDSEFATSGSGSISISGECDSKDIKISGSGMFEGRNFVTHSANIALSGSGNVHSNVIDFLKVTISGSGNIYLTGNPRIEQNTSGSGRIIKQ